MGQDKAGTQRVIWFPSLESKGPQSNRKARRRLSHLDAGAMSQMTVKSWLAALLFVAKMTKDRKYQQDNVGGLVRNTG